MVLSYINSEGSEDVIVTSSEITMPYNDTYGGLHKITIENPNDIGVDPETLDISKDMTLKLRHNSAAANDYTSLGTNPDEVEDIFLVFHYKI